MKRQFLLLLTTVALLLPGLAQAQEDVPVLVSTKWLAEHLGDDNLVVINVTMAYMGMPTAYIPGASYIDYHELEQTVAEIPIEMPPVEHLQAVFQKAGVSNDKHVVIYGVNAAYLAARAFMTLEWGK